MEFSAGQIAQMLQGTVDGDNNASVNDLSPIEAGKPGTLTFLGNPAYTEYIYSTEATIAIVSNDFKAEKELPATLNLVRVADPRLAFASLMESYSNMMRPAAGVHDSAVVGSNTKIGEGVHVGAHVVIEDGCTIGDNAVISAGCFIGSGAVIGENSYLHPGVHVGTRCKIGADCTLQPRCIIGGDGFGFAPNAENHYQKVVHLGNVILEDHVEIGASTTIDRGTLGSTIIRKGVKLDNLIQIAHNVEIGENTVIAAQTGIAGSTKLGKNCMVGGQVGIIGHLIIADETKIAAQSGVGSSIKEKGQIVQGSPALPIGDFKRAYVHFRNLHKMNDNIQELKNTLKSRANG